MKVKVQVPATTANLGPGFDTFGIAWKLYNILWAELRSGNALTVENENQDSPELADPKRNWVSVAAAKLFTAAGAEDLGAHFVLNNQIPVSRGLGSSAAAIVGGLLAANTLLGDVFTLEELTEMAVDLEGHPDNVCPALYGGFVASCRRSGETTTMLHIKPPAILKGVVAVPDFQLATKVARGAMPKEVAMGDAVFNVQCASLLLGAMIMGDTALMSKVMEDKLHQPYRFPLIPGAYEVLEAAKKAGAISTALSGAGPTLIAFTDQEGSAIGEAMEKAWLEQGIKSHAMVLEQDADGAKILEILV